MGSKGFPGGALVKNLLANAGDSAHSLGLEDPLEGEMATHSSILAWKIPSTEQPGGLQSMRWQGSPTCIKSEVLSRSVTSDSVTPRTVAHQAPLSMKFSRQEYRSG